MWDPALVNAGIYKYFPSVSATNVAETYREVYMHSRTPTRADSAHVDSTQVGLCIQTLSHQREIRHKVSFNVGPALVNAGIFKYFPLVSATNVAETYREVYMHSRMPTRANSAHADSTQVDL